MPGGQGEEELGGGGEEAGGALGGLGGLGHRVADHVGRVRALPVNPPPEVRRRTGTPGLSI